ncbi:syndecan isoform X1 [Drosophila serrata]|uniref:syndecan isoform X1 n=1 Tax=Drosophila serrata TaxID=7274 RepID=UPI000A1D2E08|nr:syndecan isoform X1 [Drosophila serrata]
MKPKQKNSMEPLFPVNGKFVMLSALLIGILVATTQAQDQKAVKPSAAAPASPTSLGSRDAIYIDDDTIEGSGGRGGIHEDLEKDPDYSGSGFGPDDEDAEPDQHSHTSHNTRISQNIGGGINSKHNSNDNFGKNSKNSNSDLISSRFNNNNNHNQIDNSQNINLNQNNNNNHQTNSGTIIGSSTTANNNNHNININGQSGIISGSENGGHSTGINSIAGGGDSNVHGLDPTTNVNSQPSDTKNNDHRINGNEVVIMSEDDRTSSFFSQPGILAAVIGGAVVGLLCAILVVMFIVYRMRKKDEGSYALDEPKRSPANNSYAKNANNREFYA